MSVFGDVLDGDDIERALLTHLRAWMPSTLAEVQRQKDPDNEIWANGLEPVRSFTVVHAANEKWPEDQLPMLLAYCPGLGAPPRAEGDGTISARFQVVLTAIASSVTLEDTKRIARAYSSAARLAILQHESLGTRENGDSFAEGVLWVDMRNYQITKGVEGERNLMGVSDSYLIDVPQVLDRDSGVAEPLTVPASEPGDWPVVGEGKATVIVTKVPA